MALSLKRSVTLALLVCVVSLAFFVGRTLGNGRRPTRRFFNHLIAVGPAGSQGFSLDADQARGKQDMASAVPPGEIFEEVYSDVQREFVEIDQIPASRIDNGALSQMLATLGDPKTAFLSPERRRARQSALEGRYYGIGAVLAVTRTRKEDVEYSHLTVVDVMPGSPAEKSGLRSGDYIVELDGRWIINYTPLADYNRILKARDKDDAAKRDSIKQVEQKFKEGVVFSKVLDKLEQGEGQTHKLVVERDGQGMPLKLEVNTALTSVELVEFRTLRPQIGYLRVRQFNARATEAFEAALDKARDGLKGLVVDLRQNPGGVTAEAKTGVDGYSSAKQLIALLSAGGAVANIERKPRQREPLTVAANPSALKIPVVVLVDQGTANLSELVACALRDAGKARLVGVRTFGDDVLQLFAPLKSGAAVQITTAHLFTSQGKDLSLGLVPDVIALPGTDAEQVERALAALNVGA